MQRIKLLGSALVAVFALSAFAASVASAVVGPLWLVSGKHLKPGETRLLLITAKETFQLTASVTKIKCESLTLPNPEDMDIVGPNKSKEHLQFTKCTVEGAGEGCKVENESILTNLIINTLGFPRAAGVGPILVLFEPAGANHANNKVFVTVKFTGAKCVSPSLPILGQVIGEAFLNGSPVTSPRDELHGEVRFIAPGPKTIFLNEEGSLVTVKTKLELAGVAATLQGIALLLVDENGVPAHWGIFWAP